MSFPFCEPERLVPQGWFPASWAPENPAKAGEPPGVRYFTEQDAQEVARLCPKVFPAGKPLSDGTAFWALTRLATSNRMAIIRFKKDDGPGHIVAVGMRSVRDDLEEGTCVEYSYCFFEKSKLEPARERVLWEGLADFMDADKNYT
ncbi:MAG TPA: hypothetical protein VG984_02385 [Candidatus Paceibacterota bacterium]|nr:hypothetical protein [Candidatus Paceibacterota bacterium]